MNRPIRMLAAMLLIAGLCLPAHALDLKLKDKIVLVTGSTSNIGYATARAFLREGATVIVNSNDPNAVAAAIESLRKETGRTAAGLHGRRHEGRRHREAGGGASARGRAGEQRGRHDRLGFPEIHRQAVG